ncbi:MAG: hypothetical protein VB118_01750 [Oscillospiraceae bacterium]|nr:hypothetical protein [Oscillospiraceae bacterium]
MNINVRLADNHDIESLIKARFSYFEAEKWEVTTKQQSEIENQLRQYFLKHLCVDFFASIVEDDSILASVAFLAISEIPANLSTPTGKIGTVLNVLTYPEYRSPDISDKIHYFDPYVCVALYASGNGDANTES